MKKLVYVLIIFLVFSILGCREKDPSPPPLPTDYIEIPEYVTSADKIEYWHRQVGSRWVSDKNITGYEDYRFTPVEFILSEIPDVNQPGRIIEKTPYQGDCDDFGNFNPYVAYARLGYDCYVVFILNQGNVLVAHAISYGWEEKEKLNCHVWDNQQYKGKWSNIDAFIKTNYPNWIIYHHVTLQEELTELFKKGHLEYMPVKPESKRPSRRSCEDEVCPIN